MVNLFCLFCLSSFFLSCFLSINRFIYLPSLVMFVVSIRNVGSERARLEVVSIFGRIVDVVAGGERVSSDVHVVGQSIRNHSCLFIS